MKSTIAVFALLALAACTPQIDGEKIEKNISEELVKQAGHKPKTVSCPKNIAEKQGGTFECTVTFDDGTTQPAHVTMQGGGNVKWAMTPSETKAAAKE